MGERILTASWGLFGVKEVPNPRKHQRGDFDFPPLDIPLKRPGEGDCGPPSHWIPPRAVLTMDRRPATCTLWQVSGHERRGFLGGSLSLACQRKAPPKPLPKCILRESVIPGTLYPSFKAHSGNIGSLPLPGQSGTPPFPAHADCEGCPPACPH